MRDRWRGLLTIWESSGTASREFRLNRINPSSICGTARIAQKFIAEYKCPLWARYLQYEHINRAVSQAIYTSRFHHFELIYTISLLHESRWSFRPFRNTSFPRTDIAGVLSAIGWSRRLRPISDLSLIGLRGARYSQIKSQCLLSKGRDKRAAAELMAHNKFSI